MVITYTQIGQYRFEVNIDCIRLDILALFVGSIIESNKYLVLSTTKNIRFLQNVCLCLCVCLKEDSLVRSKPVLDKEINNSTIQVSA